MDRPPRTLEELRAFFASAPFMADLGIEPIESGEGRVATRVTLAPRHHQHTGTVHAGVMGAMADHTMGAAAQTLAPAGHWVLTAEFKVNLLRAARVIKPGRAVSFTEAQVWCEGDDGERRLVATASATMAVVTAAQAKRS
jgi:uncharacterized protein (TIGR00369 family)